MLKDYLQEAPHKPGIYIFKDKRGAALYVGKAKDLKKRVSNYFAQETSPKIGAMVKNAETVEFMIVENEIEALILECNLIKKLLPRYNTRLTDGKSFPYVKITNEPFPRIGVTRQIIEDGSEYIGPFIEVFALRQTLKNLQTEFNFRTCYKMEGRSRPCILYHIKRCQAPCTIEINKDEYLGNIDIIKNILKGDIEIVRERWSKIMIESSKNEEFEKAAVYRDKVKFLESLMENANQNIDQQDKSDEDYFSIEFKDGIYCIYVIHVVSGNVIGRDIDFLYYDKLDNKDVLFEYIKQFYSQNRFIPKNVFVSEDMDNEALKREILKRRGILTNVSTPKDPAKHQVMQICIKNAKFRLDERKIKDKQKEVLDSGTEELRKLLELDELNRIDCIDISHFQGSSMYGAVVVYENGMFNKSEYRLFKIKDFEGIDDPRAIAEVVRRQYTRIMKQGMFPDLIIIDGGVSQLNAAKEALKPIRTSGFRLVSLAKREETLHIAPMNDNITFDKKDPRRLILEKIRDEAHRFVINSHRKGRGKKTLDI